MGKEGLDPQRGRVAAISTAPHNIYGFEAILDKRRREMTEENHKYKLTFMVKTPNGVARESVIQFTTSDPSDIGRVIVEQAAKYGQLHDLEFSLIPCPVCGKCVACGK